MNKELRERLLGLWERDKQVRAELAETGAASDNTEWGGGAELCQAARRAEGVGAAGGVDSGRDQGRMTKDERRVRQR